MKNSLQQIIHLLFFCLPLGVWGQPSNDTTSTLIEERIWFAQQTRKGAVWIGADMGLGLGIRSSSVVIGSSTALVDVVGSPMIGYFVADRVQIGLAANFYVSVANFGVQNQYRVSSFALVPSFRYYTRSGLFPELQYGWGKGEESFTLGQQKTERHFEGGKGSVGIGFGNFWMPRVNFEVMLKYSFATGKYELQEDRVFLNGLGVQAGVFVRISRRE